MRAVMEAPSVSLRACAAALTEATRRETTSNMTCTTVENRICRRYCSSWCASKIASMAAGSNICSKASRSEAGSGDLSANRSRIISLSVGDEAWPSMRPLVQRPELRRRGIPRGSARIRGRLMREGEGCPFVL